VQVQILKRLNKKLGVNLLKLVTLPTYLKEKCQRLIGLTKSNGSVP
jgi:hypothetical protein